VSIDRSPSLPRSIISRAAPGRDWIAAILPTLVPALVGLLFGSGGHAFTVAFGVMVVLLFGYVWALRERPVVLVVGLLIWLTVERLVVAWLSPRLDSTTLTWLLGYKEFFFPFMFVAGLPRARVTWNAGSRLVRVVDVAAIAFGIAIVVALALSTAPLNERVLYARRFAELPLVYLAARLLPIRMAEARAIVVSIVVVAIPVALFGFMERTFLESEIWRSLVPVAHYYHLSEQAGLNAYAPVETILNGLPFSFYQWNLSAEPIRRLVSTYLEPTTLAVYFGLAAAMALAVWPKRRRAYLVAGVLAAAAALTLGKAGLLVLAVAGGYAIAANVVARLRRPSTVVGIAGIIALVVAAGAVVMVALGFWAGVLAHVQGFKEGLDSAARAPLGYGLGYGGDFGIGQTAAESSVGVMLVQIGLQGTAIWLVWIGSLGLACAYAAKRSGLELVCLTMAVAVFAFLVTAVFTESAGGLLGNWPYALVPALLLSVTSGSGDVESPGPAPAGRPARAAGHGLAAAAFSRR
jgi:hypothetical protein